MRRSAAIGGEAVATGKASVRQNLSTTCPALLHSAAISIQTRAAPNLGSQGRFTIASMRSGLSIDPQEGIVVQRLCRMDFSF